MYTFIILTMRLCAQRNSCPKRTEWSEGNKHPNTNEHTNTVPSRGLLKFTYGYVSRWRNNFEMICLLQNHANFHRILTPLGVNSTCRVQLQRTHTCAGDTYMRRWTRTRHRILSSSLARPCRIQRSEHCASRSGDGARSIGRCRSNDREVADQVGRRQRLSSQWRYRRNPRHSCNNV